MSRPTLAILLILVLTVAVAASEEVRLRTKFAKDLAEKDDTVEYQVLPVEGSDQDDYDGDHDKCKGKFHIEKGMKCDGGFEADKGMGKKCEGGMKASFTAKATPKEIAKALAGELAGETSQFMPEVEAFFPDDDTMQAMVYADSEGVDISKSFEFGGFAKVEWGCKVTYSMHKGKLSKDAECGFKAVEGQGKKPDVE